MVALAKMVYVDAVGYPAGLDHTEMPAGVADRIRNPDAWVGGQPPPLTVAQVGDPDITAGELRSAAVARTALGLAATGDGLNVPAGQHPGDYTLVLADAGTAVEMTGGTPATVTVPANSTVGFPVGTVIEIVQYGAGQVTIAGADGVTVRTAASLTTRAQYSAASLRKRGTDEWLLAGDVT